MLGVASLWLACETTTTAPAPAREAVARSAAPTFAAATTPPAASSTVSAAPARIGPQPLPGTVTDLPIDGFPSAVVSLPTGATTRRPIAIAAHGNYDRPEWQCRSARELLGTRAFVLCPRGTPRGDSPGPKDLRFTYRNNRGLEKEVDAGLAALRSRWPDYVADGPMLWTGFSLGAFMGAMIAVRHPKRFPRLLVTEGSYDAWTAPQVRAFAAGGGQRVLFVCGQRAFAAESRPAVQRLLAAGVASQLLLEPGQGHAYGGKLTELARTKLEWLLAGDPRWVR